MTKKSLWPWPRITLVRPRIHTEEEEGSVVGNSCRWSKKYNLSVSTNPLLLFVRGTNCSRRNTNIRLLIYFLLKTSTVSSTIDTIIYRKNIYNSLSFVHVRLSLTNTSTCQLPTFCSGISRLVLVFHLSPAHIYAYDPSEFDTFAPIMGKWNKADSSFPEHSGLK